MQFQTEKRMEKKVLFARVVERTDKQKTFIEVNYGNDKENDVIWLTICDHVAMALREWGDHPHGQVNSNVALSVPLATDLTEHWFKKMQQDHDGEIFSNLLSILRNEYDGEIANIIKVSHASIQAPPA